MTDIGNILGNLVFVLGGAGIPLLFVAIVWSKRGQKISSLNAWKSFADSHGLSYTAPLNTIEHLKAWNAFLHQHPNVEVGSTRLEELPPLMGAIHGRLGGFELNIRVIERSKDESSLGQTAVWLALPTAPADLQIIPKVSQSLFGKRSDAEEIEVGDAAFDRVFTVISRDQKWVLKYLSPERRRELLRMRELEGLSLRHTQLYYERDEIIPAQADLEAVTGSMLAIAQSLEGLGSISSRPAAE